MDFTQKKVQTPSAGNLFPIFLKLAVTLLIRECSTHIFLKSQLHSATQYIKFNKPLESFTYLFQ